MIKKSIDTHFRMQDEVDQVKVLTCYSSWNDYEYVTYIEDAVNTHKVAACDSMEEAVRNHLYWLKNITGKETVDTLGYCFDEYDYDPGGEEKLVRVKSVKKEKIPFKPKPILVQNYTCHYTGNDIWYMYHGKNYTKSFSTSKFKKWLKENDLFAEQLINDIDINVSNYDRHDY